MDLIGSATQLDGTIESYRFDITIDSFDQMNLDTFKANSVSTQIVFNLAKIVDFITINKISIELCFYGISALISMYFLLFEYQ